MTGAEGSTIVFFPEGAYGPTNNCIGIADVLRRQGARVTFVVEESFAGTLAARGFEEQVMRLGPRPETPEEPGQYWKDFIRDTAPELRKPTIEALETVVKPIWEGLIGGARYVDDQLRHIFAAIGPDAIVQDNVVAFPAVLTADVPWVRIVSCNPLEMPDPDLPPVFSGLPADDRSGWETFRRAYHHMHADLHRDFSRYAQDQGCPPLPADQFMYESPFLNIYNYPAEADYQRAAPLAPTWHRVDSCVRATDEPFTLPTYLEGEGKLLYLSLGSLGSADTGLMQRLIDLLGATRHRVIVSMGPLHQELTLHPNIAGAPFLPQTSIVPHVDLVISHGGNNTVTECFHFGKPLLVLPLFWDQHDNAQRVHETHFGLRLPTYTFGDAQFYEAIDRLLADRPLHGRLQRVSARLQAGQGTAMAASLIARLAREKRPILHGV